MKTLLTFFLGLVSFFPALSQDLNLIDSLTKALDSDISEKEKVDTYLRVAKEYANSDSSKAVSFVNKALDLAEVIEYEEAKLDAAYVIAWNLFVRGYYDEAEDRFAKLLKPSKLTGYAYGEAKAYNGLGNTYLFRGRSDTASILFLKSIEIQKSINDQKGLGENYHNMGNAAFFQGDYALALNHFYQSIGIKEKIGDEKGKMGTYLGIGNAHFRQGLYTEALKNYFKALEGFEKVNDQRGIALVLNNTGIIYMRQNDLSKALDYYTRALTVREEMGNLRGMAESYIAIGAVNKLLGNVDEAITFYEKSLELKSQYNDQRGIAICYKNIGEVHLDRGDVSTALDYYTKALDIRRNIGHKVGIASTLISIGSCYHSQKEYNQALHYTSEGLALAEEIGSLEHVKKGNNVLAEVHKQLGNFQDAFNAHVRYKQAADSLVNQETTKELTRLEAEYEFNQERDSIAFEQQRASLAYEKDLARKEWLNYLAISGAVFLAIIAFLLFQSYRRKRKDNLLLEEKNIRLEALREKEQKLSEIAIASKERELATMAMATHEKNTLLKDLEQKVSFIESRIMEDDLKPSLKEMHKTISSGYSLDNSWDSFIHKFEHVHPQFFDWLKQDNPGLSIDDLKLCAYLKIGMSNKEIANVTHLAVSSVKSKINRLKKKLEMGPEDDLRDFMLKYGQSAAIN